MNRPRVAQVVFALTVFVLPGISLAKGTGIRAYPLKGDFFDARLEQVAKDGRVFVSRGNGLDTTGSFEIWQDGGTKRHALRFGEGDSSAAKVSPDEMSINAKNGEIAFGADWAIGIANLEDLSKYRFLVPVAKDPDESAFYDMPIWVAEDEVVVLSRKNWGSLVQFDTGTGKERTLFASEKLFVSDYSANQNQDIVITAGPTDKKLIQSYIDKKSFDIAPIRASRENLYLLQKDLAGGVRQLTNGHWHDIGPKISPSGQYVAFLRGRVTSAMRKEDYFGAHIDLYSRFKRLYVVNTKTQKSVQIHNGVSKEALNYKWKTGNILSYSTGRELTQVNLDSSKTRQIYHASGSIISYVWDPYRHCYDVLERRKSNYYFITVAREEQ